MISSVTFKNFKAFENYTIYLKDFNILVGANNNGKSTILDAFRILQGAYRYAQHYKPILITLSDLKTTFGYEVPDSSVSISTTSLRTNFSNEPAIIRFKFTNGNILFLEFAVNTITKLYYEVIGKLPRTSKEFKSAFPLVLAVIPTLGPFETEEEVLDYKYFTRWHGSRRSPRMFRNHWYQMPEAFQEFKSVVEETWPGMSIRQPEKALLSKELLMFYEEDRIPREICWAGFGFQIWLQLLTHIIAAKNASILIVDEPEIYLHPDLQHKILDLLRSRNICVLLATHSIEIINNAEPSEVLLVDKKSKQGKRLSAVQDLQNIASVLGSSQNINLTKLARGKKILFVEGQDIKILIRFSKVLGYNDLLSNGIITTIPIEGFSHHTRITNTSWAFSKVLGEEIKIAALLDRDYRCDDDVKKLNDILAKDISLSHILKRKEIENYALVPIAIEKAILDRLNDRETPRNSEIDITSILQESTEHFKHHVNSQLIANRMQARMNLGVSNATFLAECITDFETGWADINYRLRVCPGKALFSKINEILQTSYRISITYTQVINHIRPTDLDEDITDFLKNLNDFSRN